MKRPRVAGAAAVVIAIVAVALVIGFLSPGRGVLGGYAWWKHDAVEAPFAGIGLIGVMILLKVKSVSTCKFVDLVRLWGLVTALSLLASCWLEASGLDRGSAPAQLASWVVPSDPIKLALFRRVQPPIAGHGDRLVRLNTFARVAQHDRVRRPK